MDVRLKMFGLLHQTTCLEVQLSRSNLDKRTNTTFLMVWHLLGSGQKWGVTTKDNNAKLETVEVQDKHAVRTDAHPRLIRNLRQHLVIPLGIAFRMRQVAIGGTQVALMDSHCRTQLRSPTVARVAVTLVWTLIALNLN